MPYKQEYSHVRLCQLCADPFFVLQKFPSTTGHFKRSSIIPTDNDTRPIRSTRIHPLQGDSTRSLSNSGDGSRNGTISYILRGRGRGQVFMNLRSNMCLPLTPFFEHNGLRFVCGTDRTYDLPMGQQYQGHRAESD